MQARVKTRKRLLTKWSAPTQPPLRGDLRHHRRHHSSHPACLLHPLAVEAGHIGGGSTVDDDLVAYWAGLEVLSQHAQAGVRSCGGSGWMSGVGGVNLGEEGRRHTRHPPNDPPTAPSHCLLTWQLAPT